MMETSPDSAIEVEADNLLAKEKEDLNVQIRGLIEDCESLWKKSLVLRSEQFVGNAEYSFMSSSLTATRHYHNNLHAACQSTADYIKDGLLRLQKYLQHPPDPKETKPGLLDVSELEFSFSTLRNDNTFMETLNLTDVSQIDRTLADDFTVSERVEKQQEINDLKNKINEMDNKLREKCYENNELLLKLSVLEKKDEFTVRSNNPLCLATIDKSLLIDSDESLSYEPKFNIKEKQQTHPSLILECDENNDGDDMSFANLTISEHDGTLKNSDLSLIRVEYQKLKEDYEKLLKENRELKNNSLCIENNQFKNETLQFEYETLKNDYDKLLKELERMSSESFMQSNETNLNITMANEERAEFDDKIKEVQEQLQIKIKENFDLNEKYDNLKLDYEKLMKELEQLSLELNSSKLDITTSANDLSLSKESNIREIENKLQEKSKENEDLLLKMSDYDNIKENYEKLLKEIQTLSDSSIQLNVSKLDTTVSDGDAQNSQKTAIKQNESQIDELKNIINDLHSEIASKHQQISELSIKIDYLYSFKTKYEEIVVETEQLKNTRTEYIDLKNTYSELDNDFRLKCQKYDELLQKWTMCEQTLSDVQEDKKKLHQTIEELSLELASLNDYDFRMNEYEIKISEIERELQSQRYENTQKSLQSEQLMKALQSLSCELFNESTENDPFSVETLKTKIITLHEEARKKTIENEQLYKKVDQLKKQNKEMSDEIDSLSTNLMENVDFAEEMKKEHDELLKTFNANEKTTEELQSKYDELLKAHIANEELIIELEIKIDDLSTIENSSSKNFAEELKNKYDHLQKIYTVNEESTKELQKKYDDLLKVHNENNELTKELEKKIEDLSAIDNNSEKMTEEFKNKYDDLERAFSINEESTKELQKKYDQLLKNQQENEGKLLKVIKEHSDELNKLNFNITDMNNCITKLETENRHLKDEILDKSKLVEEYKLESNTLKNEISLFDDVKAEYDSRIVELKERLQNETNDIEDLRANLRNSQQSLTLIEQEKSEISERLHEAKILFEKSQMDSTKFKDEFLALERENKLLTEEVNLMERIKIELDGKISECAVLKSELESQKTSIEELDIKILKFSSENENLHLHNERILGNLKKSTTLLENSDDINKCKDDLLSLINGNDVSEDEKHFLKNLVNVFNKIEVLLLCKSENAALMVELEKLKLGQEEKMSEISKLQSMNSILEVRNEDLQCELSLLMKSSPRMRKDLQSKRRSLHDMNRKISMSPIPNDENENPIEQELKKKLEVLEEKHKEIQLANDKISKSLDEKNEDIVRLIKLNKQLKVNIKCLQQKKTTVDAETNTEPDKTPALMSLFVDRMTHDAEKEKNKQLKNTIEDLRSKNRELSDQVRRLNMSLQNNTVNSLLPKHKQDDGVLQKKIDELERNMSKKDQLIKELEYKCKELDEECEKCVMAMNDNRDGYNSMYEELQELREKYEQLQKELEKCNNEKKVPLLQSINRVPLSPINDLNKVSSSQNSSVKENLSGQQDLQFTPQNWEPNNPVDPSSDVAALRRNCTLLQMQLFTQSSFQSIVERQRMGEYYMANQKLYDENMRLRQQCQKYSTRIKDLKEEMNRKASGK